MAISEYDRTNVGIIIRGHGTNFTSQLLRLIAKADPQNRAKLAAAFPAEVAAYLDWYENGGEE